jgi:hypothetical protein
LSLLHDKTTLTGSKAYGLDKPNDEDRFCDSITYDALKQALKAENIPTTRGGSIGESINFSINGQLYNVFVADSREMLNLKLVTDIVSVFCYNYKIAAKNKALRVALFEQLRSTLKLWKESNK